MKTIYIFILCCLMLSGCSDTSDKNSQQQNKGNVTTLPPSNTPSSKQQDGGFNMNTLIDALKSKGYITEEGREIDASGFGGEKAMQFGNLVIAEFVFENAIRIYDKGEVIIDGKNIKVAGAVGPYMLFFLDNQIDENAARTFEQAGGYYR